MSDQDMIPATEMAQHAHEWAMPRATDGMDFDEWSGYYNRAAAFSRWLIDTYAEEWPEDGPQLCRSDIDLRIAWNRWLQETAS